MQERIARKRDQCVMPVVLEEAWGKLVSENFIDNSLLRQEIALSWKRCLVRNINPTKTRDHRIIADFVEHNEKAKRLFAVARPHIQQLYDAVKGNGYIVLLTDADGVILTTIGDRKISNVAESLSLIPGANCSEDMIGTSSPGICIIRKKPIQTFSHEHYCQYYHDWSCSSAPVLDGQGNLLGTIDLSNIDRKPHPSLLLDLVKMTAKAIGIDWNFHSLHDEVKERYHYFNVAIDVLPESYIFLDSQNNISHINKNALKLLGEATKKYIGQSIATIVPEHDKIKQALVDGQRWTNLHFKTLRGLAEVSVHINPVKNNELQQIGSICAIKEKERPGNSRNAARYTFEDFICAGRKMQSIVVQARNVSTTEASILIQGESGTGKEILAQAIHNNSARRHMPFVAVNCAALPMELIQSELFGYEEGTFTGAKKGGKIGKFELAHGGTLFLDEIGDMPMAAQANLLRALQEKCIMRLGGVAPVALDVRVIAATNKDLQREISRMRFRADLYYRLAAVCLHIPPLRERNEDIWPIAWHIIKKQYLHQVDTTALRFTHQVKAILETYGWPGNVRELENVVVFFLNRIKNNVVTIYDLPLALQPAKSEEDAVSDLRQVEQCAIQSTLARHGHNISASAKALGISRATLYRKMRSFSPVAG